MRKLIIVGLLAVYLVPQTAMAHTSRHELRQDRRDIAEERGELRRALHKGSPAKIREERREYHAAVRELHEDQRDWARHHRCGPRGRSCWR